MSICLGSLSLKAHGKETCLKILRTQCVLSFFLSFIYAKEESREQLWTCADLCGREIGRYIEPRAAVVIAKELQVLQRAHRLWVQFALISRLFVADLLLRSGNGCWL